MDELVLVTGGTGFIGQALVAALLGSGRAVRVLARPASFRAKPEVIARLLGQGAEVVRGDVLDRAAVRDAARGTTHILHLAGLLQTPGLQPHDYQAVHIAGTRHVLEAAAAERPQVVVHCSTAGVLGPTGAALGLESDPPRPSTCYEHSKAEGERLALTLAEQHGLHVVVVRPALAYGPGDYHLAGWFRSISRGLFRVVGRGDNLLHPVYITDLVDALVRAAWKPGRPGGIYNVAGHAPVTMQELSANIAAALGRRLPAARLPVPVAQGLASVFELVPGANRAPLTHSRLSFMLESRQYCVCRARLELGFVPRVGLAEGLQHTVGWYRQHHLV